MNTGRNLCVGICAYRQEPMRGDAYIQGGLYAWGCVNTGRTLCMGMWAYGQDPMHGVAYIWAGLYAWVARIQDVRCEGTDEIRYGETGDWMMRQQLVEKYGVK